MRKSTVRYVCRLNSAEIALRIQKMFTAERCFGLGVLTFSAAAAAAAFFSFSFCTVRSFTFPFSIDRSTTMIDLNAQWYICIQMIIALQRD